MTTEKRTKAPVRQLRLIVEAEDYEAAVAFYRDVLGLTEQAAFEGEGDASVTILDAGRATLELSNPAQIRMTNAIEPTANGARTSGSPSRWTIRPRQPRISSRAAPPSSPGHAKRHGSP